MAILSLFHSPFTSLSSPPSSTLTSAAPGSKFSGDRTPIARTRFRRLIAPSAHSNPKLLKTNRRSRYGEALSVYDSDGDDDEEVVQDSTALRVEDENDGIVWFEDNEDEFAEPADLNRGQQRSKLRAASQLRTGTRKKQTKADGKGKLGQNNGANKKYFQLSEEFRLDNRWIPLLDYLSTLGMKDSDLIHMYKRHSNVFYTNVFSARERLAYLLDVGVKQKDIKKILLRQPQILEYTVDNNLKSHIAFLVDLGIPDFKIGQVITAAPSIFSYSVEDSLKPTVRYLIEEIGIKESDLAKVVTLSPQMLVQRVDISWNDRYDFLSDELGASRESIVKMVRKHPQLLHYSIEDGLLPRINFLRSIGMNDSQILKVLTSITQVFSLSLERNLKPKYKYLINELQNNVQTLTKYPTYLSLSLDQRIRPWHRFLVFLNKAPKGPFPLSYLVPTDESFCQQWAGTSVDKYLAFRLNLRTSVFSLSLERNLKPKYKYLINELQNNVQTLTKYPTYLSLSLDQRIRPRHRFLVFLNKAPKGPFPLSYLVPTDESFCQQWAGTSVDKYLAFRQNLMLEDFAKKYEKQV